MNYLEYINSINIEIITEPLNVKIQEPVLNTDQDWDEIAYAYQKNKVVIVDNFLKPEYAERLRRFKLALNKYHEYHQNGYFILNYNHQAFNFFSLPIIDRLVEDCKKYISIFKEMNYVRGWSFLYDYNCRGVEVHADYNDLNINFWVTPNECMQNGQGYNGLTIYKLKPSSEWDEENYNGEYNRCIKYIEDNECEVIDVPYNYNRAVFFESKFFHTTQPVVTNQSWECKRINYTLLWDEKK